jgi:hypothetical protein
MLHRNMRISLELRLRLDDLLADLQYARRNDELGRMALLTYCEVRCWARQADEAALAAQASAMFTEQPHVSRAVFLAQVDSLIEQLKAVSQKYYEPLVALEGADEGLKRALNSASKAWESWHLRPGTGLYAQIHGCDIAARSTNFNLGT